MESLIEFLLEGDGALLYVRSSMKSRRCAILAIAWLLTGTLAYAGVSATVIIYQPIIIGGEATVIETPKGFAIMPVPFECYHYHGRPPFDAVAQPNPILTDAPRSVLPRDSNLASLAGVTIGWLLDEDNIYVHFENLRAPGGFEIAEEDVAEATLECIRRMAAEASKRPTVQISGRRGEQAKWKRWQDQFNKHDLAKQFKRPEAQAEP